MRCTDCGGLVRPVVAIDIDGTLADFHSHFLAFGEQYLDVVGDYASRAYDGTGSFREWCCGVWDCDEYTWRQVKLAYRQGGMKRSLPPFHGAAEICRAIREAGAELWVTTTRPYLRLDGIDPDTRFWLERRGIEYDGLLYDEDKYLRLAERVEKSRVVAVLDDLPEQWSAASEHFGWRVPLLRRTTWNRGVSCDQGVDDLVEGRTVIVERIKTWLHVNK